MNWADTAEPSGNLAAAADTGLDSEFDSDSELDSEPEPELDLDSDLDLDPDLGLHWCFARNCQVGHLVDSLPRLLKRREYAAKRPSLRRAPGK